MGRAQDGAAWTELAASVNRDLARLGSPERAVKERAYMKSALAFHGVDAKTLRRIARDVAVSEAIESAADLRLLTEAFFSLGWFDLRSVALLVLERRRRLLGETELPWLVDLVRQTAGWAHVDLLATAIIGPTVCSTPNRRRWLVEWAQDSSFWVRRTALLAQLEELRRGEGDFELFAELAVPMYEEKEFFIQKAIGWVLREVSKRRPERVIELLASDPARPAGLTFREATRRLPAGARTQLEARRAEAKAAARSAARLGTASPRSRGGLGPRER